jgi:hypothetical protein
VFVLRSATTPAFWHFAYDALARATSAALIPSNASLSVTPSSMMWRSFWVIATRV